MKKLLFLVGLLVFSCTDTSTSDNGGFYLSFKSNGTLTQRNFGLSEYQNSPFMNYDILYGTSIFALNAERALSDFVNSSNFISITISTQIEPGTYTTNANILFEINGTEYESDGSSGDQISITFTRVDYSSGVVEGSFYGAAYNLSQTNFLTEGQFRVLIINDDIF